MNHQNNYVPSPKGDILILVWIPLASVSALASLSCLHNNLVNQWLDSHQIFMIYNKDIRKI